MAKPEQPEQFDEALKCFSDRKWRLNNLYWIQDKLGNKVKFNLNPSQAKLLKNMHALNLILKARQMGFSTFILILTLDCCLFNSNFNAGLIADTMVNAQNLLKRIKYAYKYLPGMLKAQVPFVSDNKTEIEFANNSWVEVGVSLRSGTKNLLHISEYGRICAKNPDKAEEIKTGSLNTLAKGQLGFIESTAEGRGGDFHKKTMEAQKILDSDRAPSTMEYRLHFFAWFEDDSYELDEEVAITAVEQKYFDDLEEEHGIILSQPKKNWYALKWREQGDEMVKEYPATVDEAFSGAKEGSYWGKQIQALRQRGKIGRFEFVSGIPVNTFWDLGLNDSTTIWLHQLVAGRHRFVGYYENSNEGIGHYIDWLEKWRNVRGAVMGRNFGPHDVEQRKQGLEAKSIKTIAQEIGFVFETVKRTSDKRISIQTARSILPECEFDEAECDEGIQHLEGYSREWDDKHSVWKNSPLHNEHSHGADGFITFSDGYKVPDTSPPLNLDDGLDNIRGAFA